MNGPRVGRWLSGLLMLTVLGCARSQPVNHTEFETLELRSEGYAGVVGPAELAEDLGYLAPIKLKYMGNNSTGGPHSIQSVASGDLDIGGSFNGAIVKVVANKAPVRSVVAAYGTDGETYTGFFVLEGSPIRSARDLIGKTVAVNTLGAHSEFALREYLSRAGLTEQEIAQVTVLAIPAQQSELVLRNKQVDVANLQNLFRDHALARGGVRKLFSDDELWGRFNAGSYVMSTRFIAKHPNTVRKFVEAMGKAFAWSRSQPREVVIARMQEIVKKRKRHENASSIAHWKSYGVATDHGQLTEAEFKMWIGWLERAGQLQPGQVKPSDIYTNDFQPKSGALSVVTPQRR